ncbi:MAG: 4'-phosphopantetheinyl transferase superfamily protein [Bacteroidales bacterium]|nr:4'-phosphopantetheinyl transferase superfamily protein [Bacteroidales bacterium]
MGLILQKYVLNDCLLGIWEIVEDYGTLYSQVELTKEDEAKLMSFRSYERKLEWLSVRLLLKTLTDSSKRIVYGENRKPFLADDSYHISVSHSNKLTSILLGKTRKVGIDLEYMSHKINRIADRFVNSKEYITTKTPDDEKYHLYIHWCAKEALYKICDKQSINFKENLYIYPFEISNEGALKAHVKNMYIDQHFNMAYFKLDNYIVVWCTN